MAFAGRPWGRRGSVRSHYHRGRSHAHRPEPDLRRPLPSQVKFEMISSTDEYSIEDDSTARIQNVEYVASYNWQDRDDPAILVPGKPPRWQPRSEIEVLPEDSGVYLRDQNSARYPSYPIEPAIRAILSQNPDFDLSEIEVFGCGNTIGGLLCFAKDEEKTFRFGVELLGTSLFLIRKTNSVRESIESVSGYGHNFQEVYTPWERDVQDSVSHQRIIKYDFAGLKCFIRSECDGYLPELCGADEWIVPKDGDVISSDVKGDDLSSTHVGAGTISNDHTLVVNQAGQPISQQVIFDLKTRSKEGHRDITVDNFLPRLWANQTPNFILAFHRSGRFKQSDIYVIDATEKTKQWEAENGFILSRLGGLIHKLIKVAKEHRTRKFEVRRTGTGPLTLWTEPSEESVLSDDLQILWNNKHVKEEVDMDSKKIKHEQT